MAEMTEEKLAEFLKPVAEILARYGKKRKIFDSCFTGSTRGIWIFARRGIKGNSNWFEFIFKSGLWSCNFL